MRRFLSLALIFGLVTWATVGCNKKDGDKNKPKDGTKTDKTTKPADKTTKPADKPDATGEGNGDDDTPPAKDKKDKDAVKKDKAGKDKKDKDKKKKDDSDE